uniref:SCP domain-containing protein n=1 Tax=Anopheles farauti TaxID=69004 RepID=A0A182Q1R0_9DIPT
MVRLLIALVTFCAFACHHGMLKNHSRFDYCDKNYCPPGKRNIGCGCNFDELYGPGCANKNAKWHILSKSDNQQVLHIHNLNRNRFACGQLKNFPAAVRMVQLRIDDDLQTLAQCNIKNCVYGHDECRSTERFRYAGQNIAKRTVCGRELNFAEILNSSMSVWFNEYWDTTTEMLAKYPDYHLSKPIGHFTQIVNDNVYFIGCALISYAVRIKDYFAETGEDCRAYYFACNYSFINLKNRPTYATGAKPAQKCHSHARGNYKCLCSEHEPYSTTLDWEEQLL